ncbi:MAG: N-6 DNA methylase [Deltaproteobacteria bacterium]|nr:N-6 DNA methylase [Deltaproteobacteria bacterium]
MARTRKPKADGQPQTTAQQLGSVIKSARDIMRKDKGLSTDIDRLPLLTWAMFLKFLDDVEQIEESKAKMRGEKYRSAIERPYRWRDWAAVPDGMTGPEMLAFVNQEKAARPDGVEGVGLLAYLRGLQGGNGSSVARRRRVIAAVFKDITCRMLSGYLLRDVVNKVNGIHFLAQEELFTLGHLYETMLREMRDAAGQNGEFYTPRPVVRFMVAMTDPQLGETVLDPACGTGGFLVETYRHLEKKCKTVADRRALQERSLLGGEAKPLPYLLCQMNLLLHGLDAPQIDPENSLRFKLLEMGDAERVDIVLTNPPFGGEEEAGIKGNFSENMQTAETALLFLQLIMRRLKRPGHGSERGGRAAVVVPNGTLFGDGVSARIKEQLLKEFDLHTVVRLPNGVFAPYTLIPTNLLFFDRSGPTKEIWFYEVAPPEDRKNYSKTKPMQFEEFAACMAWWKKRKQNGRAWKVRAEDVLRYDADGRLVSVNLDLKNPSAAEALEHLPPEHLADEILEKERRIIEIVEDIKRHLAEGGSGS